MPEVISKTLEYLAYLEARKETNFYSNFVQGKLWQEKLKEFEDKFVLPIYIYYVVENIFSAALFNSNDRKTSPEGNDANLKIPVDELNFLSREGIELNIEGEVKKVYFALVLLLGDNEALNSATRFIDGPDANTYCRFCKIPKHQTQQNCPL